MKTIEQLFNDLCSITDNAWALYAFRNDTRSSRFLTQRDMLVLCKNVKEDIERFYNTLICSHADLSTLNLLNQLCITLSYETIISMKEVLIHEGVPVITVLLENLLHFDSPLAIGIGIDGAIDYREQIVIEAPSLKWEMVHLKEIVERQVLSFVQVDHRVNGAALYEGMLGVAAGCSDYICAFAECPDKFAIVMDGNVVRGHHCLAGKLSADPAAMLDTLSPQLFLNESCDFDWPLCKKLEPKPGRLAHGMAFAARLGWMKSIYFLL